MRYNNSAATVYRYLLPLHSKVVFEVCAYVNSISDIYK